MSEARRCDRCNEFYSINDENEKRGEYHPVSISYKKSVGSMTLYDNNVNRIKHLDLCPACSRSLIVWLNDWSQCEDAEKEEDITVELPESDYGECPYFKSESSGLMCKQSSTCDKPCKRVDLYKMQEVKVDDASICDSCSNITKCSLQYDVKRTHCDMYKAKIDHVNCPYRKDVVCAPNKDKNCVICDVYNQVFG